LIAELPRECAIRAVWYRYKRVSRPKVSASLAGAAIFVEADRMAVEAEIRA